MRKGLGFWFLSVVSGSLGVTFLFLAVSPQFLRLPGTTQTRGREGFTKENERSA